jgi:hypothetical protein
MELLSGGQDGTSGVLFLENDFKELRRAISVGIGQGRSLSRSQSQVVESFRLSLEQLSDISPTGVACKLDEQCRSELLPSVEAATLTSVRTSFSLDPV